MTDLPPIDLYDDGDPLAEGVPLDDVEPAADQETADRYLRLAARYESEADRIHHQFGVEIERLVKRRDDLMHAPRRAAERFAELAKGWALANRTDQRKSFALPSGTIKTSAGRERIEVDDEKAVVDWWCAFDDDDAPPVCVVPDPKVHKPTIAAALKTGQLVARDGAVVTAAGEVVPGVRVVVGDVTASIVGD